MGGIVSAIGDVVGGAVDVVGSVAEAAVDVAGSVVEAVADNPLLAVAAVATPFALSAMAAEAAGAAAIAEGAAVGNAVTAGSILGGGMTGAGMMTADMIGGALVNQALMPTVLQGIGGIGVGAGIGGTGAITEGLTPVGPNWTPTPVDSSTLGSTTAGGWTPGTAIDSSLNAAVPDASLATEQGSAVLNSTGSNLAINDAATHASESIINASPSTNLSTAITQAKDAVDLTQAGIPVDTSVATATNGAINVNPLTEIASSTTSNVKDAWNFLSSSAQNLSKNIGETVLPGADPAIQKYAGQFVVNTGTNVATGQDFQDALTSAGINIGAGIGGDYLGKQASSITGSPWAGKAASTAADIALKGGDVSDIASGVGSSLIGSGIKDVTGSSLAANVGSTLANSAFTGTDPTASLVNTGVNTVLPQTGMTSLLKPFISAGINQALAPSPTTPTSNLPVRRPTQAYVPPAKMNVSQLIPINNLPKTTTTAPVTTPTATVPAYVAPQHVDVSTLSPVTNIAGLTAILNAKKATV